jgi:hypothetical protein
MKTAMTKKFPNAQQLAQIITFELVFYMYMV